MPSKSWPYPTEDSNGTVVGEAEEVVRAIRDRYVLDVERIASEIVGRTGRGFMQVTLSPEERQAAFEDAREADDPAEWGAQLERVKNSPRALKRLLDSWVEQEEAWRQRQQHAVIANFPGATAPPPPLESQSYPDADELS